MNLEYNEEWRRYYKERLEACGGYYLDVTINFLTEALIAIKASGRKEEDVALVLQCGKPISWEEFRSWADHEYIGESEYGKEYWDCKICFKDGGSMWRAFGRDDEHFWEWDGGWRTEELEAWLRESEITKALHALRREDEGMSK